MEKDFPKKILQKVRDNMENNGIDILFLMKESNIRYVSGLLISIYSRPIASVIPLDSDPVFVAPMVETVDFGKGPPYNFDQRLSPSIWIEDIKTWYEYEAFPGAISDPFHIYKAILEERKLLSSTIGLDGGFPNGIPYQFYKRFRKAFPNNMIKDCTDLMNKCRAIKFPEEIQLMKAAAELADVGVQASIKYAGEGRTEQEIDAVGHQEILRYAARKFPRYIINMPYTDTQSGWVDPHG